MGTEKPCNFVFHVMCYDANVYRTEITLAFLTFHCIVKYVCLKIGMIIYSKIL